MRLPSLWTGTGAIDPFRDMRRAMRRDMNEFFPGFGRDWPSVDAGLPAPAINVAETDTTIDVTAELPGVDQKDIKVSLDGNRLVIAGEKKSESDRKDKDWHVVERAYGSFHRAIALPFEPRDESVEARFDKGVLHLSVKKPVNQQAKTTNIEIKPGAPAAVAAPPKAA